MIYEEHNPTNHLMAPGREGDIPHSGPRIAPEKNFIEFMAANAPEPKPEPKPWTPRSLHELLAHYHAVLDAHEAKGAEREKYALALSKAKSDQRAKAQEVGELKTAYTDSILTDGRAAAKKALVKATEELAELAEEIEVLNTRFKTFPLDDSSGWHTVRRAKSDVLRAVVAEELKRFPPEALAVLQAAYMLALNGEVGDSWGEWLGKALPEPLAQEERTALFNEALRRHEVVL